MIKTIRNFRELGGIKVDGGVVKEKTLLRGGPLNTVSNEDMNELVKVYNLTTVIDFRDPDEIANEPNRSIEGVTDISIRIIGDDIEQLDADPTKMFEMVQKTGSADFMSPLYASFVTSERTLGKYHDFIEEVANSVGSVYFHCTAGKDRTGFGAAVLLKILGASQEDIYHNYMLSNDMKDTHRLAMFEKIKTTYGLGDVSDETIAAVVGVRPEYLDAAFNAIADNYQDFDNFRRQGLKISDDTVTKLKEKYITKS